ncbi:universal stress protein [Pelagibacterium xiamenense]|uniref:universal stress protein n=1 Tax=Pelagibacterium xiamenense TaxID=2901140 RepID=UPI001E2BDFEC|nr:universal stress protein [Pelagibacterium xiamenense]MCD7060862.1 universal stress protein [Pelagibacterium xiamenense]
MYKHILIATDGSDLANKGLKHGLSLAQAIGAKVLIVSVTDVWSSSLISAASPAAIEDYQAAMNASVEQVLADAAVEAKTAGIQYQTKHVQNRYPADAIVEAAQDMGCDLIVISSHGRRGVRKMLLGSQTSEVLASTTMPVLVVR